MSESETRPVRNMAAWGLKSSRTGTEVEIDVWTVNEAVRDRDDAIGRAREAFADDGRIADVIDATGNVAKVAYAGAAGVGYRYIDMAKTNPGKNEPSDATQQAFAGAKRSAGGGRGDDGTFDDGWTVPPDAPDLQACVAHGRNEVIPAAVRHMREAGAPEMAEAVASIRREPSRDEDEEPTQLQPFSGFENAVRIYPRGGSAFEYSVDVSRETFRGGSS